MHFRRFRCKKKKQKKGDAVQTPAEEAQPGHISEKEAVAKPLLPQPSQPLSELSVQEKPPQSSQPPLPNGQSTNQGPSTTMDVIATGTDVPMNEELKKVWDKLRERVRQLAEKEGKSINDGLDVDDVLANLEASQHPDENEPENKETVKKYFNNTLNAIKMFGGVVANATSQVFAPAATCYNLVSFIIDGYQGYQGVFDGLGELLESCTAYLGRLTYYIEGKMDAKLTGVADRQLNLFVQVCDTALNLRHSASAKFKTALKVVFLADDGIQPLLTEMAKLVNEEHRLVSAQIFVSSRQAADAAHEGLDATKRVEAQVAQINAKGMEASSDEAIKAALGFKNVREEPTTFWRNRYREYLDRRVPETGKWIFDEPAFTDWENGKSAHNILAIEGGSGSGKSFLTSSIIHHFLHKKFTEGTGSKIYTAYYFFEGKSRETETNAANLETATPFLVWQFIKAKRSYKRSVGSICAESQEVDPAAISRDLLFENPHLPEMNGVFYIIIDGLSGTVGEGMRRFLERASVVKSGRPIRVLMTVDSECSQHLANVDGVSFHSIPISSKNRPDVQTFIGSRMDSMLVLSDQTRPGIPELRERICNELCEATGGDYFKINFALDDISKLDRVSDIEDVLNGVGKERTEQVSKEIQGLNQTLSKTEISEINKIIVWIRRYRGMLTEKEMTAALYERGGESSLLRLPDKFKEKYPLFNITNKGEVAFRAPEVEESIPTKRPSQNKVEEQHSPGAITPGEMAMVKQFLSTVCPRETYDKLDFDQFLEQKMQVRRDVIYKGDPQAEELKMALTCLRVLTEEEDQQSGCLLPYARRNFTEHLSGVDLAWADIEYKSAVGALVTKLFTHDASIDTVLHNIELSDPSDVQRKVGRRLVFSDDFANVILRWLGDSVVVAEIENEETRAWISDVVRTEGHKGLLAPAAKRMAIHLVHEPHFKQLTRSAFLFVASFFQKFESGDEQEGFGSVTQIENVERWCEQVLKPQEKTSLWHTQIGSVLHLYGHRKLAADRAREALEIDKRNWRASTLLSEVVGDSEGIKILELAVRSLESSGKWKQSHLQQLGFAKMLFMIAERSWRQEQFDNAIGFWKRAVELNFTHHARITTCLEYYVARERWSDMITILQTIDTTSTEHQQGLPKLIASGLDREMHGNILQAALHTEQLSFVVGAYERTVKLLEEDGERATLCDVRYHCGRAANALQNGSSRAIDQWRQALEGADPYLLSRLISDIAPYYLGRAIASGQDNEAVEAYLEKIKTLLPEGVPEAEVMLPPSVYVARYYARQDDMAQAKQFVRDIVQVNLDILSDDIEENDLPACNTLLWVFIALNDVDNMQTTRAHMALRFGNDQAIYCDGDCDRYWHVSEKMMWCQDCINTNFDEECYQKIKKRELPFSTCNETHIFYEAEQMPESWEDIPSNSVPFRDEVISFEDWLGHIEKDYVSLEN